MCGIAMSSSSRKMDEREKQYRAEDDHRTLSRVAEIEADPERVKYAREHHRKQSQALARVGKRLGAGRAARRT